MNHRDEHRAAAQALAATLGRKPTGEEYAHTRRLVAADRRERHRQLRVALDTDRVTIRVLRGM